MRSEFDDILTLALQEDIGSGDITSNAIYHGDEKADARIIVKEKGIIAGLEVAKHIFGMVSAEIEFTSHVNDGTMVKEGHVVATVKGPANKLLTAERTVLNFMQRMSGVASLTHLFVEEIKHTPAKILDTRKTMPGLRYLDKWAVRLGGGTNHRLRLDDLFLIKENHIAVAGSIEQAIQKCLEYKEANELSVKIEIEVSSLEQLTQVLDYGGADIVMLDNMPLTTMKKAVDITDSTVKLEASGNITRTNVSNVAETGVDYISVGALTHSASALDISLLMD